MNTTLLPTDRSEHTFYYLPLIDADISNNQVPRAHYVCLIWLDHEYEFSELVSLGRQLIRTGCRYAVCGGEFANLAELAVDLAYVQMEMEGEISEENCVMTTAHVEESIYDVVYYFKMCTNFDHHEFKHFLVLTINIAREKEQQITRTISLSSEELWNEVK